LIIKDYYFFSLLAPTYQIKVIEAANNKEIPLIGISSLTIPIITRIDRTVAAM